MRKIQLLIALTFICSTSLFAQLEKNKFYPGLSVTSGFNSSGYELEPSASWALSKHSLITVFGRYQHGRDYYNPNLNSTNRNMESGIGVGYTYYRFFKGSK